jgi:predicted regulator of Ras-like GTPase activity (Roadblock/LC7/MglB family)
MFNVLSELNKTSGVRGSMLVGMDGIIIAADLESSLDDDAVGALSASIMANIGKAMERLNNETPKQITVEAELGKLFLTDAGLGILTVVADKDVNIGLVRLEIKNALSKIRGQ